MRTSSFRRLGLCSDVKLVLVRNSLCLCLALLEMVKRRWRVFISSGPTLIVDEVSNISMNKPTRVVTSTFSLVSSPIFHLDLDLDLNVCHSHDDKRYTEKKNKTERARRRKEDKARRPTLVDLTLGLSKGQAYQARGGEAKKKSQGMAPAAPAGPSKAQLEEEEEEKKKAEEATKKKEEEEKVCFFLPVFDRRFYCSSDSLFRLRKLLLSMLRKKQGGSREL